MLTVAFDATPLLGARTGVGTAVSGWLTSMAARPDLHLRAYGLSATGFGALRDLLPAGVASRCPPLPAGALQALWGRVDHPSAEAWTGAVDVVHGTNFVVPPTRHAGRLVTVWDLTCVRFPELCSPAALRYPHLVRRALAAGATVHTTSHAVADEVVEHFALSPDRVVVVAPGITVPAVAAPGSVGTSGRRVILALGTVEPRKDLPTLVRAFDLVADGRADVELHVAGPPGWAEADLTAAIAAARHRDRIRRVGWVADRDQLLSATSVFAYPSRYEGFGFPPLEAMALGVPVVATSTGAIPEVLGDAAVLVPVADFEALAAALGEVLDDDGRRQRLVAAGHDQVRRYPWPAAAEGMVALYRRVAPGSG